MDVVRALVVHGADGLDELSLAGPNRALLVEGQEVTEVAIDPIKLGLKPASASAIVGGDAQLNAAIALSVLGGEPGPPRDIVLLNAAAALWVAGLATDVADGLARAAAAIDSGRASEVVAAASRAVVA
jgi:anthranilate phosphoribosyltransferase